MKTSVSFTLALVVEAVVGLNLVSVKERDHVTLQSDVVKQGRDKMLWYFNDTLIALINGDPSKSCVYDGEGEIFRDRLTVDYETGSLTITNIGREHIGLYEANFIKSESSGTSQSLNRNGKCDSSKIIKKMINIGDIVKTFSVSITGESFSADSVISELHEVEEKQEHEMILIAGMCVGAGVVLLLAAAVLGVIYYRYRSSKMEDKDKNNLKQLLDVSA
ncbi:uncharacterized protein LOC122327540 isoform X2 [Puntigrus tetrazona]|uniref:uncharacterized protein LOC122327540 isoform X2 n=1 Tax=Puntigrus tetrazona TaxID=1606681 RepID=UPI001C8A013D|nr:uncharacterized protein LOC122327540 isoform X2 [Puntigrus tetrazona]